MLSSQRLQSLQKRKELFESQIADLEDKCNKCNQQLKGEGDLDKRSQINAKIDNYQTEINEIYDKIDEIEKLINNLKLNDQELSSNNHLDNPKNQQELKIDELLCYIDFKKALDTFDKIKRQFNSNGDVALFFMEEHLSKRGDLCLQRLRNDLSPNNYRQHFRHCPVTYTSGNLNSVVQGIANFFEVKEECTIQLVINKIGNSLQNNSFLFIEIKCDISDFSEIDPLIPWFVDNFWQPLRQKVNEITQYYEGIKVVAVIISDFHFSPRFSEDNLIGYCNEINCDYARDKLVKIPLENWTKDDIANWLIAYVNPKLKKDEKNKKASRIYNITQQGSPHAVCSALQQEWKTLIDSPISG